MAEHIYPRIRKITPITCEQAASLNTDLLTGFRSIPPVPPPPGWEAEIPSYRWQFGDGGTVVFSMRKTFTSSASIAAIRAQDYLRPQNSPASKVVTSDRLDAIEAVALIPQNGLKAKVALPGFEASIVGFKDDQTSIEFCTRIAEYVVANNLVPE